MKTQPTLIAVMVLGALVAGLFGTCGYQYVASAAAAYKSSMQRAALENAKRQAAEILKARANARQLDTRVVRRASPWSWSEQLPVMVSQISGVLEGSGVKIDTLQPAPIVERQQVARFPLRVTLSTDLASLTKVLQRMQQAVPVLAIDQIAIRAGKQAGDPLKIELTLSSYVQVDDRWTAGE